MTPAVEPAPVAARAWSTGTAARPEAPTEVGPAEELAAEDEELGEELETEPEEELETEPEDLELEELEPEVEPGAEPAGLLPVDAAWVSAPVEAPVAVAPPPAREAPLPTVAVEPGPSAATHDLATDVGEPAMTGPDANIVGIVIVPGIGRRQPGDALLASSHPLLSLVGAWQATTRGVKPRNDPTSSAAIDLSGATRPFVRASVPAIGDHPARTWIMTEAPWGTRLEPPPVAAVLRWLPRELARLWTGIVGGEAGVVSKLIDLVGLPLLLVPALVAVLVAYLLLRLVRLVPWRALRDWASVASVELLAVDRLAGARVLVTDRLQAANARARVAEAIEDCRAAGCGTVALVGGGSGAIAAYMTLADETYASLPVDLLVTHGEALGIAWRLGRADEYDTPDREPDRLYRGDRLRTNLTRLPFRSGLRWHDFTATHDASSAGGLESGPWVTLPALVQGASVRVHNRMSLRRDHDAYWDNVEEFVLPVARLLDGAPPPPADVPAADGARAGARFFPESDRTGRVARRRGRVRLLQRLWVAVMAAAVAAAPLAVLHPLRPGDQGSLEAAGFAAWDGLAQAVDRLGLGIAVGPIAAWFAACIGGAAALVLLWLAGTSMARLWTRWDARERRIALQPIPAWRPVWPLALQLGLCGAAALWLLVFVASGDWQQALASLGLVALAWVLGWLTPKGRVRRPTLEELDLAGVRP